jgi:hypothetical protein
VVGEYSHNGGAAQEVGCLVVVVERVSGNVIAKETFYGGNPPKEISSKAGEQRGATGSKPESQIVSYLANLPQR